MKSNPIQQRIEQIVDEWEKVKHHKHARIIRLCCMPDEVEMVDTFYTYMIASDTRVEDIAFLFDTPFVNNETYSRELLEELAETIGIWNNSQKDERIEFVKVDWEPDYTLSDKNNPASLFVNNFNRLAEVLSLPSDIYTVAVLKNINKSVAFSKWLQYALKASISTGVKFIIDDTVTNLSYEELALKNPQTVYTAFINLDMPNALVQLAGMGNDPNDPALSYRVAFMKMMNAMQANEEKEVEEHALQCIKMASHNIKKDAHWLVQVMLIYICLGSDKLKYKKTKEAFDYANKAVETATTAVKMLDNNMVSMTLGQALMFRGTLYFSNKKYENAYADYHEAYHNYITAQNTVLAIEAARMAAQCAQKNGQKQEAVQLLAEATRLGQNLTPQLALGSTYAGIVNMLLDTATFEKYISLSEVNEICMTLYGNDWEQIVLNWMKASSSEVVQHQAF